MELMVGLAVSLIGGFIAVEGFEWAMVRWYEFKKQDEKPRVPARLTGVVERLFFTLFLTIDIPGTAVAMILWLTVKMATNYNWPGIGNGPEDRSYSFKGLLSGFISMLFALIGGLIYQCLKKAA